jgi:hypothetical protein
MNRINWPSAFVTALAAYLTTFAAFLLLFGNSVIRNILYTDSAGQSNKFLQVWHTLEPLPAVRPFWEDLLIFSGRKAAVLGLLFVWAVGLVVSYATVAEALPGKGWRKGLSFGALLWVTGFFFFEVFFPFNILGEPFGIVLLELALQVGMVAVLGVTIAVLYRPPDTTHPT